jgi:hypothetical protein
MRPRPSLALLLLASAALADDFGSLDLKDVKNRARNTSEAAVAAAPARALELSDKTGEDGAPICVYQGRDRVATLHMLFSFLREKAGFRPESDWRPELFYFGAKPEEKQILSDFGLEKAIAMSYDPFVEVNNTVEHAVMITPHVFDVACRGNEVGWVVAHEIAHHKLGHMEKLKAKKLALWPAWRDKNRDRFVGVCAGLSGADAESCFRKKIFAVFIEETPEIAELAKQQEKEADVEGNAWMTRLNPSYTKESAKAVLDRIKEYERRLDIPPSKFYDAPEVRALNLDRRAR